MIRVVLLLCAMVPIALQATAPSQAGSLSVVVRTPAYLITGDEIGGVVELPIGVDGKGASVSPVSVAACSAPTPKTKPVETRVAWSVTVTPLKRAGEQLTAEVRWHVSDVQPKSTVPLPKRSVTVQLSPGRPVNLDYVREALPAGCQVLGHGLVVELKSPDSDEIFEADIALVSPRPAGKQNLQAQSARVRLNRFAEVVFDELDIDTRQGRIRGRVVVGIKPVAAHGDVVQAKVDVTTLTSTLGQSASSSFNLKLAASERHPLAVPFAAKDSQNPLSVEVRVRRLR